MSARSLRVEKKALSFEFTRFIQSPCAETDSDLVSDKREQDSICKHRMSEEFLYKVRAENCCSIQKGEVMRGERLKSLQHSAPLKWELITSYPCIVQPNEKTLRQAKPTYVGYVYQSLSAYLLSNSVGRGVCPNRDANAARGVKGDRITSRVIDSFTAPSRFRECGSSARGNQIPLKLSLRRMPDQILALLFMVRLPGWTTMRQ